MDEEILSPRLMNTKDRARLMVIEWLLENAFEYPPDLFVRFQDDPELQRIFQESPEFEALCLAYFEQLVHSKSQHDTS